MPVSPLRPYTDTLLPEFVRKPYFRLVSAGPVGGSPAAFQVRFESKHDRAVDPAEDVQAGTLTLDPARCYAVTRADLECVTSGDTRRVAVAYQFADSVGGVPVVKSCETRVRWPDRPEYVHTVTYQLAVDAPPPAPDTFQLTAFGLPEPAKPGNPARVGWWVGGAAAVFVTGYAVRRAARRRPAPTGGVA